MIIFLQCRQKKNSLEEKTIETLFNLTIISRCTVLRMPILIRKLKKSAFNHLCRFWHFFSKLNQRWPIVMPDCWFIVVTSQGWIFRLKLNFRAWVCYTLWNGNLFLPLAFVFLELLDCQNFRDSFEAVHIWLAKFSHSFRHLSLALQ